MDTANGTVRRVMRYVETCFFASFCYPSCRSRTIYERLCYSSSDTQDHTLLEEPPSNRIRLPSEMREQENEKTLILSVKSHLSSYFHVDFNPHFLTFHLHFHLLSPNSP